LQRRERTRSNLDITVGSICIDHVSWFDERSQNFHPEQSEGSAASANNLSDHRFISFPEPMRYFDTFYRVGADPSLRSG
jgi:hypothetical protein